MLEPESWPSGLSDRTRDVITATAEAHADDPDGVADLSERLAHAVARRLRSAAEVEKRCGACGELLPAVEFATDRRAAGGLFWRCRPCDSYARRAVS